MEQKRKFFGTDGIRAKAGQFPLVETFIEKLGFAAGKVLGGSAKKVLIGQDTRESGHWIFESLCKGFNRAGFKVDYAGVVPTPCISLMVRDLDYVCGVMISASHNAYHDNGIKFFSETGEKLSDKIELLIEQKIANLIDFIGSDYESFKKIEVIEVEDFYLDFLKKNLDLDLTGFKVAIDCANGSFFEIAPDVLKKFGAETKDIAVTPNGRNINENCGSTNVYNLRSLMNKENFDIGFAFDGDGDRVIAIRSDGKILDGDFMLGMIAKYLKSKGKLKNNLLVLTVMSNLGLKIAMQNSDIDIVETDVGDRYVYEAMLEKHAILGGEQSGHIILKEYNNTGDGFLAALFILKILKDLGTEQFFEWSDNIQKFPQILVNVKVKEKKVIEDVEILKTAKAEMEKEFHGRGRVLIRYSGTEPLMRIMIEGEDEALIKADAEEFARLVRENL